MYKTKEKKCMEETKMKINVYRGLDMIGDMIKITAICRECGKLRNWLHPKISKKNITLEQLDDINIAIWRIANRLLTQKVVYSDDRQAVIDQIHDKFDDVRMPYVYRERMGKNRMWYVNRTRNIQENKSTASFTESEIIEINLVVAEIAVRLLNIELVLDE